MLAKSSNNPAEELRGVKAALSSQKFRWGGRLLLLGLNCLPLVHVLLTVALSFSSFARWPLRAVLAVAFFYLVPPLVARIILLFVAIPQGRIAIGSRPFFGWWAIFQMQVVFCRLPALEELIRLIPGLYSQWLRLWGARIGRFTYWSPGTSITDRSFLAIGNDVVLGAGVRLNPHVLANGPDGRLELLLATVKIGDRVMVGGYTLLTAGTEIVSDEVTRACLLSSPFSVWQGGKRVRNSKSETGE